MKNLLSIGDVAKIKNVSPKSLRYYEQIGVLIPNYVNPETGYRYYTNEQLLIVDLITTCIDLDLPLKQFHSYMTEQGNIDAQKLLKDGNSIVESKIKHLELTKKFLNNISSHVERTNRIKTIGTSFVEDFPERYFLTIQSEGDFENYKEISGQYSQLFKQCKVFGIADCFNQGILTIQEKTDFKKYVFLEVPHLDHTFLNLHTILAGKFLCEVVTPETLANLEQKQHNLLIKELFDLTITPHEYYFEVQIPL